MSAAAGSTVVERLAGWVSSLTFVAIPDAVSEVARRCLIDTLGVAIAGATTTVADRARAVAISVGAPGHASVLGVDTRLAAPAAAFANATAAHALDFDDNCYSGIVHGSAIIAPAAIALAETIDASGAALLTAFVAGSEAEYAVGAAATASLYEKGWWTTTVLGPIGSCAACANLLGLDARATAAALGIAIAGAGGAKSAFGTDAKPLLAGRAAEAGLISALLGAADAGGPRDAIEHSGGFAALFNGGVFQHEAIDKLGKRWRLLDPGIDIKRIPVCLSAHAAVDAVLDIVARDALDPAHIARIVCDVPPIVAANLVHEQPRTPQEAQFSLQFAIACSLCFGDLDLGHLTHAAVAAPAVVEMMSKIEMRTGAGWSDPALIASAPEGAKVRIERVDGTVLRGFRDRPRGSAASPLTEVELEAKFRSCVGRVLDAATGEALLGRIRGIASLESARRLLDMTSPGIAG